jgi:hypothetical protein
LRIRKDADLNQEIIRTHAKSRGESVNGFLIRATKEAIDRDGMKKEISHLGQTGGVHYTDESSKSS